MPFLTENEKISGGQLHFTESVEIKPLIANNEKNIDMRAKVTESLKEKKLILKPKIAAIHEGRTRNHTIYQEDKLRGTMVHEKGPTGMYSFMYPYKKPMLKNHDTDSEPTGRIESAQFVKTTEGHGYVMIVPHITDQDTVEKILDGRYLTVSIGASTDSAICNVCGTDIIKDGWCEHERGQEYDGTTCGWILGNLWFDECSWVNVPADTNAIILNKEDSEIYAEINQESYDVTTGMEITDTVAKELGLLVATVTEGVSEENVVIPNAESTESTESETTESAEQSQEENTTEETNETDEQSEGTGEMGTTEEKTDNEEAIVTEATTQEEDTQTTTEEENNESQEEGTNTEDNEGNAPDLAIMIESLNTKIQNLESVVADFEEKLKLSKFEHETLVKEFSAFIRKTIEIETTEETKVEGLEELSITELTEKFGEISIATKSKLIDYSKFQIANPFGKQTVQTEETSKENLTPIDIYADLFRGKKSFKSK